MEVDLNPADFQLCDGFELHFINSDQLDLDRI